MQRALSSSVFPPTVIWRHRKENLKKCSLRGLEGRADMAFYTYPKEALPDLSGYVLLTIDAPELSALDCDRGLFLIDGTWRYAAVMEKQLARYGAISLVPRSLPAGWRTAYPRRQDDCCEPGRGLASIEALFAAYFLMGRETSGLLDGYHWREEFLAINAAVAKRPFWPREDGRPQTD